MKERGEIFQGDLYIIKETWFYQGRAAAAEKAKFFGMVYHEYPSVLMEMARTVKL